MIVTRLPFVELFQELMAVIAPEFFDKGSVCLEISAKEIDQWPRPVPGLVLNLPLLGTLFQVIKKIQILLFYFHFFHIILWRNRCLGENPKFLHDCQSLGGIQFDDFTFQDIQRFALTKTMSHSNRCGSLLGFGVVNSSSSNALGASSVRWTAGSHGDQSFDLLPRRSSSRQVNCLFSSADFHSYNSIFDWSTISFHSIFFLIISLIASSTHCSTAWITDHFSRSMTPSSKNILAGHLILRPLFYWEWPIHFSPKRCSTGPTSSASAVIIPYVSQSFSLSHILYLYLMYLIGYRWVGCRQRRAEDKGQ